MSAGVEVEERRAGVFEVVVAGHSLVDRGVGVGGGGDGEVEGDGAEAGEELGHVGGEAGDVEEGCYGAGGDGDGGAVAEVAGVVLVAAADGDVAEGEACCWGWEGDGGLGEVLVGGFSLDEVDGGVGVNVGLTCWHDCVFQIAGSTL